MSLFNCLQQDEMKIRHITYDETHRRQSISRRASDASTKIRNYISRRLSHNADATNSCQSLSTGTKRPVTRWPRPGTQFSLPEKPREITAYLTKQHREGKAARKEEQVMDSTKNKGAFLPLSDTDDKSEEYALPRLRRMPKFSDVVKEKLNRNSTDSQQETEDGDENVESLQMLRRTMKEGSLEQVVPLSQPSRMGWGFALPNHPFIDQFPRAPSEPLQIRPSSRNGNCSHQRSSSRSRKTRSTSSKFADYIRTTADILDEKRRDVQSKFQAPFEHLNYPSFSLSRRISVSSSKSAESFWCVGEDIEEQKSNTQAIREFKTRQQESALRDNRLSGVGMSPWTNHVPDNCKHCGQFAMIGPRRLCEECEYRHRGSLDLEHTNRRPDAQMEEEIRPTPPLKDHKTLSMRRGRDLQNLFQVNPDGSGYERRPAVPPKDMGSRLVSNPVPSRQLPQNAQVQDSDGDEEWYLNWKTSSQRDEFEKTQSTFQNWSLSSENHDRGRGTEDNKALLLEENRKGKRKKKALTRDTEFYQFYDDVLEDKYK